MPDMTSLNSQTVDSVALIDTLVVGLTPPATLAILDGVMAETLGLAMHNAVTRQQSGGLIATAAVSAVCARIVGAAPQVEPLGQGAAPSQPEPKP